jgi:hypothetical protein
LVENHHCRPFIGLENKFLFTVRPKGHTPPIFLKNNLGPTIRVFKNNFFFSLNPTAQTPPIFTRINAELETTSCFVSWLQYQKGRVEKVAY